MHVRSATGLWMKDKKMKEIVEPLLQWYDENKRDLPWRHGKNPYHIWLSEIMLQQTRVEAVKGYYARFLETVPQIKDLAVLSEDVLMKLWQGLGYYNRARNLKKAAQQIMTDYDGIFPKTYEEILKLPGIGEYTAGAVASIAFDERVPAVDGNVYRIYTRLCADDADVMQGKIRKRIRKEIAELVPEGKAGAFNQAWMDLGATVCLPNGQPVCAKCPLAMFCMAHKEERELEFPVRAPKKARRIEERTVFLLEYQNRYCIQKRPDKGLLAGLWEFPSQSGSVSPEELQKLLQEWDAEASEIELLGNRKHIFSHVEWRMLGYLVHLQSLPEILRESMVLSTTTQLREKYSIPSAFSGYLEAIYDHKN